MPFLFAKKYLHIVQKSIDILFNMRYNQDRKIKEKDMANKLYPLSRKTISVDNDEAITSKTPI